MKDGCITIITNILINKQKSTPEQHCG